MSCGVGKRHGSDPALLWLWYRAGSYSSDSTPSLGTSICLGFGPKKQKKKKKKSGDLTDRQGGDGCKDREKNNGNNINKMQ